MWYIPYSQWRCHFTYKERTNMPEKQNGKSVKRSIPDGMISYFSGDDLRLPGFWLTSIIVFLTLLLFHLPYLTEPPFWDEIFGLHNQSIWLARHNFHVGELYSADELYIQGGSLIYSASFIPCIFGVFYALFPPRTVHLLCRLLSLFSASVCVVCFLQICRLLKLKTVLVWLTAILFVSFPLFMGQAVSAGQETEIAALMMLSLLFFMKDRFGIACLFALIACLPKPTAIVLLLSYALYYAALMLFSRFRSGKKQTVLSLICILCCLVLMRVLPTHIGFHCDFSLHKISGLIISQYRFFFRDFFLICAFSAGIFVFSLCRNKTILKTIDPRILVFLMTSGGFFAGYFLQSGMAHCPRYAVVAFFPAAAAAAYLVSRNKILLPCILFSCFILLNLLNQQGRFLPDIPEMAAGNGSYYERSKEYFNVIRSQKEMIRQIEQENDSAQYLCTWPYPQILTMPEYGYVAKPMDGILTEGNFPKYAGARHLNEYDPGKPVHYLIDFPVHPPFFVSVLSPDDPVCRKIIPIQGSPHGAVIVYDIPGTGEKLLELQKNGSMPK